MHAVSVDEFLHESTDLRLLHKVGQEFSGMWAIALRADRLLHSRELPVEDPSSGQSLDVLDQSGSEPRQRVQTVGDKKLKRRIDTVCLDQVGVFDVIGKPEAVSGSLRDGNTKTGPIHLIYLSNYR